MNRGVGVGSECSGRCTLLWWCIELRLLYIAGCGGPCK